MTNPSPRSVLLLAACLSSAAGTLSGCGQQPGKPGRTRAASASAPARDLPPASAPLPSPREAVLYPAGVPVTSLSYDSRVFFDFGQDRPRAGAGAVLDSLARRLAREPDAHVAVLGHTDSVGGDAYNMALSRRRAASVVRGLEARGLAGGRLRAIGMGRRQPVASDDTPAGRARNRRVEFLVSASARAIAEVISARPGGLPLRENHPAPQALHARQPTPLSRAPLGEPITY